MSVLTRRICEAIRKGSPISSQYSLENLLNDENIPKTIARLRGLKPVRLQTQEPVKKAGILIPVCVIEGKVSLLYIRRPCRLTSFKEVVNFPGTAQKPEHRNLLEATLIETQRLVGLKPPNITIWGTGNLIVARREFSYLPIVGQIDQNIDFRALKIHDDVHDLFTIPVEDLCTSKQNGYTQFRDGFASPVFLGGEKRIWGLTALLTNMFLKSLVHNPAYTHKIKTVPEVRRLQNKYAYVDR
ncbi:mitochondrial coenzyme A diphosphatase NUDT8-like [Onthophagus taurus]|uniref:mitochondrial coenzyme A diphosphatase NUDT8-like n=1 Tax=Onthophagus taurus TaxID=166361 RepID=UPI000C2065C4|nr:nucleoside diphosphate-linked moiety X motif 8-like [Onthophagus taurus]